MPHRARPRPRRRYAPAHYDVTVDSVPAQPMTLNTLTSKPWFAMMVVGAITLTGFYYGTTQTLQALQDSQKADRLAAAALAAEQKAARDKLTDAWQKNYDKSNEVLGQLVTRMTVNEKSQERTDAVLNKISDQLQLLKPSSPIR